MLFCIQIKILKSVNWNLGLFLFFLLLYTHSSHTLIICLFKFNQHTKFNFSFIFYKLKLLISQQKNILNTFFCFLTKIKTKNRRTDVIQSNVHLCLLRWVEFQVVGTLTYFCTMENDPNLEWERSYFNENRSTGVFFFSSFFNFFYSDGSFIVY